jgi:tetratricopeptide (TPR) repeat protein
MDATSLESLEIALQASPDNSALRLVVVRGWLSLGMGERAGRVAAAASPDLAIDEAGQRDFARALALVEKWPAALGYLSGTEPETLLERSRVLLALERRTDAAESYRLAVQKNPTLEDEKLAALLRSREPEAVKARPGAPRLRVVANDDTDKSAVQKLVQAEAPRLAFKDGPPGCGKTLLARATAGECTATFMAVAISDILDMYIGESERKLHAIFEEARRKPPAVLFFDELEALAGKRKASRDGVAAKIVSQFLSEMDGFAQNNKGVLILGATNVPWEIDAAFRRPGRFDRVLFVPPPDREARAAIIDILLRDRPVAEVDREGLSNVTTGFSGADLENVVETAADFAIEESIRLGQEVPIRQEHVQKALASVRPTTTEWLSSARNFARYANEGGQYDEVLAFLKKHGKA